MKIKKNLKLRKIGKQYMIVENAPNTENETNVYTLNATAGYLWESIGNEEVTKERLVELLCEKYDVDKEMAEKDIETLLAEWKKMGLLED